MDENTSRHRMPRSTIALSALFVVVLATLQVRQVRSTLARLAPGLGPGAVAPSLSVTGSDGTELQAAEINARPRVISFWATWCGPCQKELPEIAAAVDAWNADPASVVDVAWVAVHSGDEGSDEMARFVDDPQFHSATFVLDRDRAASERWRVQALPTTYFVGRDGTIRIAAMGYQPTFDKKLAEAFRVESGLEPAP